jgi:hypothetical protein
MPLIDGFPAGTPEWSGGGREDSVVMSERTANTG